MYDLFVWNLSLDPADVLPTTQTVRTVLLATDRRLGAGSGLGESDGCHDRGGFVTGDVEEGVA